MIQYPHYSAAIGGPPATTWHIGRIPTRVPEATHNLRQFKCIMYYIGLGHTGYPKLCNY